MKSKAKRDKKGGGIWNGAVSKLKKLFSKIKLSTLLENKRLLLAVSVVTSVVIWFAVSTGAGAVETRIIKNVAIEFDYNNDLLDNKGLRLTDSDVESVDVTLTGPRYIINSLTAGDIRVSPLTDQVSEPGEYALSLKASLRGGASNVSAKVTSTDVVFASFDKFESKIITIQPAPNGTVKVKEGYYALEPQPVTHQIDISGPSSILSRIDHATAHYNTVSSEISSDTYYTARISLYDKSGNEISDKNITVSKNSVEVLQEVYKKKTVQLKALLQNAPEGFHDEFVRVEPETLEIAAPEAIIDEITRLAVGVPVDINALTADYDSSHALTLPDNIINITGLGIVRVTINYSAVSHKEFTITNVKMDGIEKAGDYSITPVLDTGNTIEIYGKRSVINSLKSSDLYAVIPIDPETLTPGQKLIAATIVSESGKLIWTHDVFFVTVNITKKN